MNFLLRSTHVTAADLPPSPGNDLPLNATHPPRPKSTLEGLISEDPYLNYSTSEAATESSVQYNHAAAGKDEPAISQNYIDVTEELGSIAIPISKLPHDWKDAPNISSFQALDRSFVFPGEQIHVLACLSCKKEDTEIITPFKVAAVMTKNGMRQPSKKQDGHAGSDSNDESTETSPQAHAIDYNGETVTNNTHDKKEDISTSESLLRMEDHKKQTEMLLQTFKNSHFFVRIEESDVPLWSKSSSHAPPSKSTEMPVRNVNLSSLNAVIDRGNFNANVSGGAARDIVECFSLPNGDIVVLLQVNIGVEILKDPVLEILQFEKYQDKDSSYPYPSNINSNVDPCGELLKWLLPLDNVILPPSRSLSPPPPFSSTSGSGSASLKSTFSASFGHFRSYSMSSLPPNTTPPILPAKTPSSKPDFNLEDWDSFSSNNITKGQKVGKENLLSFRGVSLEPERFSVSCGLEGIYIPGRRWRKKLEIVQPVEIYSFAADCNTDDLLCVQIKNVAPSHIPDVIIYVDAITVVYEEASTSGPPLSVPIACVEAGSDHSLPNLALRRGEIHSFILKPATSASKIFKSQIHSSFQSPHSLAGNATSNIRLPSKILDWKKRSSAADQYSLMVSCRCNYTESRLFFKQITPWRPRVSRDLMISVASEISKRSIGFSGGKVSQLPVQVLTLQASNYTSEDLTLTVLAPASFTSPPSVVSLNSSPTSPISPFVGFAGKVSEERRGIFDQRSSSMPVELDVQKLYVDKQPQAASNNEQVPAFSDVIPSTSLSCSHLWLQSRVPLGCVPSHTMATIKLELLPLTDGIITLDTLQIDVKEKGITYIPECSLKINATSSISSGIM
uniref:Uncharacterized protein n=1 Tax=Kalanchoe fedtschenkoi TaxID=63787 RepID=A0A7N1A0U6_KALFE